MSIRDEIKSFIAGKGRTMKQVHEALDARHNRKTTYQNFAQKLARNTLRYEEAKEIADVLGYKIIWVEKD